MVTYSLGPGNSGDDPLERSFLHPRREGLGGGLASIKELGGDEDRNTWGYDDDELSKIIDDDCWEVLEPYVLRTKGLTRSAFDVLIASCTDPRSLLRHIVDTST